MPPELELLEPLAPAVKNLTPPLLTIAIPTFNRACQLGTLLGILEPQLAPYPEIELLVSDNASEDTTPAVLAQAAPRIPRLRIHRHATNIGSDRRGRPPRPRRHRGSPGPPPLSHRRPR